MRILAQSVQHYKRRATRYKESGIFDNITYPTLGMENKMAYTTIAAIGECTLNSNVTMDNSVALMTDDNIVHFCGEIKNTTASRGSRILTLPNSFPTMERRTVGLCCIEHPSSTPQYETGYFVINTSNQVYTAQAIASTDVVHLDQLQFSMNGKFYSTSIGNTTGFTSPLSAR